MKKLLIVFALLLIAMPILAQDDMDPCVLDPPMEAAPKSTSWAGHFPLLNSSPPNWRNATTVENLTVNIQLLDSPSAEEQANLALAGGGDSPWAVLHTTPARMVVLSGFDALLPLNDLVEQYREEYNLDDIPQPVWDAASIDGKIYGVPFMSNTMHLFYRTDIFEAHGLGRPHHLR